MSGNTLPEPWYLVELDEDFDGIKAGTQVAIRRHNKVHSAPGIDPCWELVSPSQKVYVISESYGGRFLRGILTPLMDDEDRPINTKSRTYRRLQRRMDNFYTQAQKQNRSKYDALFVSKETRDQKARTGGKSSRQQETRREAFARLRP